jgi:hypothetical protein
MFDETAPIGPGETQYLTDLRGFELVTDITRRNQFSPEVTQAKALPAESAHIVGKEKPRLQPRQRRAHMQRQQRFRDAVSFAYEMDWPLTVAITVSWDALLQAGEHNSGHCLSRGEWGREACLRRALARLCRGQGLPFVALYGRDVGKDMGSHVHLAMFWP